MAERKDGKRVDPKHPTQIAEILAKQLEGGYSELWSKPIHELMFHAWMRQLSLLFRADITEPQELALYEQLQEARFTNGDLVTAAEWIVHTKRSFPFVADFLACPDITRNQGVKK